MKRFLTILTVALWAGAGLRADIALVLGNGDYRALDDREAGAELPDVAEKLRRADFRVIKDRNNDSADLARAMRQFIAAEADADPQERIVVLLAGRFVRSANDTYLLPVDFPKDGTLADAARQGMALSTIYAVLQDYPGRAVLVLGVREEATRFSRHLVRGVRLDSIPQGVTVIHGPPDKVVKFAQGPLTEAGVPLLRAARRDHGLRVAGFRPSGYRLIDAVAEEAQPAPEPAPAPKPSEPEAWKSAREADTIAAYDRYLDLYPDGANAKTARAMIKEIRSEPYRAQRLLEEELGLNREARRGIQRDLSVLGYNTRGLDGIFGPGTRSAITGWQRASGYEPSSYLTGNQIARLDRQARERVAELEEEARRKKAAEDARDRQFWEETGRDGGVHGLRAYLESFPDGIHAEEAQARLDKIAEERRAQAQARDRDAWDKATAADTAKAYRSYLANFPEGAFVDRANARIRDLERDESDIREERRAKAQEDALNLNRGARRLIEARLDTLGLKPGAVDGKFDDSTRRALRRYQKSRGLAVTGYVNDATVVRLLADAVLR